jgi:hypothetical protein
MARRPGVEAWDVAGFTDPQSQFGRAVPTGALFTFKDIRLDPDEQHLLCDCREVARVVLPTRDLLDGFVQLAEAPAASILRYARKWGLLYLDPQGRPCTKLHQIVPGADGKPLPRTEPLEAWRYYSRRARAVLNLAAQLQQGKRGDATDWAALDAVGARIGPVALAEITRRGLLGLYAEVGCPQESKASIETRRRFLTWELMLWLDVTRPTLTLKPTPHSWQMEITYKRVSVGGGRPAIGPDARRSPYAGHMLWLRYGLHACAGREERASQLLSAVRFTRSVAAGGPAATPESSGSAALACNRVDRRQDRQGTQGSQYLSIGSGGDSAALDWN